MGAHFARFFLSELKLRPPQGPKRDIGLSPPALHGTLKTRAIFLSDCFLGLSPTLSPGPKGASLLGDGLIFIPLPMVSFSLRNPRSSGWRCLSALWLARGGLRRSSRWRRCRGGSRACPRRIP